MWKIAVVVVILSAFSVLSRNDPKNDPRNNGDLALWIDEKQVKMFSGKKIAVKVLYVLYIEIFVGVSMQIYAIVNGNVLPYILDPNFEKYLPVIPSEVSYVNFTWKAGMKKYYYNFDRLQSFDESILEAPVISIKTKGRVPKRPKEFSVLLPCIGNSSGIATFGIGLLIESRKGKPLNGTPLRLKLRKECSQRSTKNILFV